MQKQKKKTRKTPTAAGNKSFKNHNRRMFVRFKSTKKKVQVIATKSQSPEEETK